MANTLRETDTNRSVKTMNTIADEMSSVADSFREYWEESAISEHEGNELAEAYNSCQFFSKLVSLRTSLNGLEKASAFYHLDKNMGASLTNVEGAQIELHTSLEDAITADGTRDPKGTLLNLNGAYETFTASIALAISTWRDRPDSAPCS
ncbi:hypothetical protein TWF718_007392 [Orbilia javanica]|uniref:Uncharacterized protein n=1 Tax=Orbilia javanica TaxID=47235 RepID=A0AAN8RD84_9PEZI